MIMLFFIFTLLFPFCSTRGPPNKRYNNQPPKFSKFPSVIYVYENTTYDDWNPTVLEKIEISTETFDTSQPFNLKVIKGNEIVNVRKFNPRTYNIILKSKLDRELQDEFTITFELSYLEHKLTRSSILFVKDSNDEHPKFTNLPGSVKVMENTKNQNIFKIKAIDKDLGLNSVVKYRLNNFKDLFGIMEDGSVYLKQSLDYETCTKYNLKIIASDIGGLESVSNLIVNVIDSNDETPIFLVQPYVVKIKEHTEIGKKVVQIQAIDGDTGINNTIHYKIENDESQKVNTGIFKIHPENGWIYVNKDIEVDMKQINTTVVAFEVDSPLIFSKTNVYFEIIDINNNAPRFNVKKEIVGYIQENSKTNTKISWKFDDINFFNPLKFSQTLDKKTNESYYNNVYVTDWDHGKNSEILVSINSNSKMIPFKVITSQLQNKRSMFKVDLYLIENSYIDYENIKMYEFSLVAREKNTQEHYQDEIKVVIHVTDLNDIWPTFSKFSYHVKIKENSKPGTFVANVTANDGDFLDKNGMSYNITKNHGNTFEINNFGAVQITSNNVDILNYYLDYETTPIIYLIIYVYDGVNHSAKCQLVIELIDTNDNPPIPIKFNFMMHIPENTLEIPVIPKLMAIDKDAHPFNIVNYKITLTQKLLESNFKCSNNNFHIDRLTGTLSLLKKLDAEKCRNHNIVVFLYNPDNHLQNSTISIQVLVSDVNDNRPYFDKKVYNYQTNEALFGEVNDVFRRQLIINTHAIDKDVESPNNNIFYKIVDIYYGSVKQDNTIFKIDTNTGVVSLFNSANLDFEISGPTIDINVVAYDGGVPSLSNNTIVRIHVADINDNTPYFDNNNVNIELRENLRYTTSIGACFAVDRDSDSNLEYTLDQIKSIKNDDNDDNITSISNKTESKYSPFELNPVNCKIFLKGTLDHESVSEYKLTIKVVDKSGLDQEATTIVNVKVLDENDNWPVLTDPFVKSSRKYTRKKSFDAFYNIHVPETTKIGTIVGKIQAYDLDSNDVLKYHLINNISHVSVDDSNGSIRLKKSLDREKLSFLILNVKVEDLVGHAVYGNYSILIDDENDNAPIWELLDDFISVSEEYPIFKPFYKVTATDKDVDVYGKIIYRIKEPLDASESDLKSSYVLFGIKQETGQIYLKQSADAEIKTIYKMHVEALDNAGMEPYNLISKLLYINIKDFNDERPIFKEKYHERMYHVMNYSPIGFKVMKVEATDNDATIPNNEISYYFEQSISNSSYFFIIDRRTGIISLSESLQNFRKTVYLRMYIIAIDNGEIPLSAKTSVLIKIFQRERVNFSLLSDETNISISIPENQHPSMIYQFKVKPIFENMKIYYSLRNYQNYSVSDKFEIESNTGKLFSLKKFDHEYKTEYWLKLYVTILNSRSSNNLLPRNANITLSDLIDIQIKILDVDDNSPAFPDVYATEDYTVDIYEEWIAKEEIARLPYAIDEDYSPFNHSCYFMTRRDDNHQFLLDSRTNYLYLVEPVDRELRSEYKLQIAVTSDCDSIDKIVYSEAHKNLLNSADYNMKNGMKKFKNINQDINSVKSIKKTRHLNLQTLNIIINIKDINDNPPKLKDAFKYSNFYIISYDYSGIKHEIIDFSKMVYDVDSVDEENLEYLVRSPMKANCASHQSEKQPLSLSNLNETFKLNNNTGILAVEPTAHMNLTNCAMMINVIVYDTNHLHHLSISASVIIVEKFYKTFISINQNIHITKRNIQDIRQYLCNETSTLIVIDNISVHDSNGSIEYAKTDVIISAIDKYTKTPISSSDFLNRLDKTGIYKNLKNQNYFVENIMPLYQVKKIKSKDSKRSTLILTFGSIVFALVILFVAFIFGFLIYRKRLKEKLHAAESVAYDASISNLSTLHIQNSRKIDRINPIWMNNYVVSDDSTSTADSNTMKRKTKSKTTQKNENFIEPFKPSVDDLYAKIFKHENKNNFKKIPNNYFVDKIVLKDKQSISTNCQIDSFIPNQKKYNSSNSSFNLYSKIPNTEPINLKVNDFRKCQY